MGRNQRAGLRRNQAWSLKLKKVYLFVGFVFVCLVVVFTATKIFGMPTGYLRTIPRVYTYKVVREFYHDPDAFTQGLQFEVIKDPVNGTTRDIFLESTGLYGESTLSGQWNYPKKEENESFKR
eukprot:TRINITY_DN4358_c0_g2_i2.p3 TRINITY_DN4358_c0_g2~~TRINITY_DN4358_c0_g2_i2.p3  ORF type:complete len:135 (-),score=8.45 TRINITY_DN4358_c0_g2_i2:871-1239(-)